ncbi:tyrosine-type recombinase/integrase [Actinomycetota bacterium]
MDININTDPLRGKMEKELFLRIKGLSSDAFLNAYKSAMGQSVMEKSEGKTKERSPVDEGIPLKEDIIGEYQENLKSNGKAVSTVKDYLGVAKKFMSYLGKENIMIKSLQVRDIEKYLAEKRGSSLQNNSFSKYVNSLRSFLKFLSREYISNEILEHIKAPSKVKTVKETLSDLEIKRLEKYLENRKEKYRNENLRDSIIFYLGIRCGLRRGEIIVLNWEDTNLEEKSIKVLRSKGEKSRKVYFNDKLKKLLLEHRKLSKNYSGAVIRGFHGRKMAKSSLQNLIDRMFKESGIKKKGLTLHSLRHTYADALRKRGTDMQTISELLGHSNLDTTAAYLHVDDNDLKEAAL